MSVAVYIAVQQEIPGFDPFVNGKAIGRIDEQALGAVCSAAGVKSLWQFVSQNPEDLADFLGDDAESLELEETWFAPAEGLRLVEGLLSYLDAHPDALPNCAEVKDDLTEYQGVFAELAKRGVHWHFAVDI